MNKTFYQYEDSFAPIIMLSFTFVFFCDINIATPAFFWLIFPSIPQFTIIFVIPQILAPGISICTQDILRFCVLLLFTSQILAHCSYLSFIVCLCWTMVISFSGSSKIHLNNVYLLYLVYKYNI